MDSKRHVMILRGQTMTKNLSEKMRLLISSDVTQKSFVGRTNREWLP
jgi:hypothetical protein